ncbi:hypothetical protein C5167_015383 [Papaver somniferum]|uniref:Peptidase M41 domain-containing protein n=1 Tax=Papaver somniferum TaxID=3469 RepID=A0A4Y7JA67_PAPSO|nr:hypothetical protein C5167_015383 [Papaver somniferum]
MQTSSSVNAYLSIHAARDSLKLCFTVWMTRHTCLNDGLSCCNAFRWNLEEPMTVHGEPPPWRRSVSFVGPRMDFEGSLYDDYDLIEPPINFKLDDDVAKRTEELIRDMYEKTISLLRSHHAALLKTVRVLLDNMEISGDEIEYILDNYPAETPLKLLLEEENPGTLPFSETENGLDLELSFLVPSEVEIS